MSIARDLGQRQKRRLSFKRGVAATKLDERNSAPEVVSIFEEIQQKAETVFQMIRVDVY
jgi:hypothetical protein